MSHLQLGAALELNALPIHFEVYVNVPLPTVSQDILPNQLL
jgi:hypothetical protein